MGSATFSQPGAAVHRLAVISAFTGLCSFVLIDFLATPAAAAFVGSVCLLGLCEMIEGRFPTSRVIATASVGWVFVLMSPLSTDPYVTARYSLLVVITMAFPAMMSAVISRRAVLSTVAVMLIFILPFHFILGRRFGDGWQGLLSSKNYFSLHMALTTLFSFYLVFSAKRPPLFALGIVGVLGGAVGLVLAGSAGAIIASVPALTFFLVWSVYARVPTQSRGLLLIALGGTALIGAFLFVLEFSALRDAVLFAFSKDAGLTGRDYLWLRGWQYIQANPLVGYGYDAFWQQGNIEAEGLWRYGGIDSRTGFNFHNFYIHNLVDVGIVGFSVVFAYVVTSTIRNAVAVLRTPDQENIFFFTFLIIFWERTYVEVDFPSQFALFTFLIASTFAYSFAPEPAARPKQKPGLQPLAGTPS